MEEGEASGDNGGRGGTCSSLPAMWRASSNDEKKDANGSSILEGVTAEGDTALHVVATSCAGCAHGDNFLKSARIIYGKARHLLFAENKNGDTPLHCAARAAKSNMVACFIDLALAEGVEDRMKELLRKENKNKETALHEAVRVGNNHIVDLLMDKDSELGQEDGGSASPLYQAIVQKHFTIADNLAKKSRGKLSFRGPNGQNVLHAAVHRRQDLTKLLGWIGETHLGLHITKQRDENGSTPLHFAAAIERPSRICRQVFEANPDALYLADHAAGFFPIHVAASVGAFRNIDMFVKKCPSSAGLRDAKGRTFLHVAVEKNKVKVIRNACRNPSLSWIMNMVDSDGNTALHHAVEAGSLRMFCHLLANPQVNLDRPNKKGETPLDIAECKVPDGLFYKLNSQAQIRLVLRIAGAAKGVRRQDHFEYYKTLVVKRDGSKELEALKDSAGAMCIVSVLIATVTFGATFAVPGGYIADDHNHGGSPVLARRYAFDAFIASNTMAFVFSTMATIALMQSGSPLWDPRSRRMHLRAAYYLVSISITSLAAAFALGAYVVLAPVAHKTAVATCVLTSLVILYTNVQFIWIRLLLLPPLCTRKGLIWAWRHTTIYIMISTLYYHWPLIFIFGWAASANLGANIQASAPAPLA